MDVKKVLEAMPLYINARAVSSDTLKAYRRCSRYFVNWLFNHSRDIDKVTEKDAREWVYECRSSNLDIAAVNQRIAACRCFFKTAIEIKEFSGENPFAEVKGFSVDPVPEDTKYYTAEEVKTIYNACQSDRERGIILLMAIEGLRTVEILRMQIKDWDFANGRVKVHGKGGYETYAYPSAKTLETIQRYIGTRTNGGVFLNDLDNAALSREGIRYIVNQVLIRCKLKRRGNSCHALRHSCGTNLYQATKDLRLVQETLRHKTPLVTSRYTHISKKNATNIIANGL